MPVMKLAASGLRRKRVAPTSSSTSPNRPIGVAFKILWVRAVGVPSSFRGEESRGDRVDADTKMREMNGKPLGEILHRGFSSAISRDFGEWRIGVHAGDIKNGAAFSSHHVFGKDLGGEEGSDEIQIEDEFDAFLVQVEEGLHLFLGVIEFGEFVVRGRARVVSTGTINEDISRSEVR